MPLKEKGPYRLRHVEHMASQPEELREMTKGDVVMREVAPHMIIELNSSTRAVVKAHHNVRNIVWIVNRQTGTIWPCSASQQVWLCTNMELHIKTMRRPQ